MYVAAGKPLFGYHILSLRIFGSFSKNSFSVFFVSFFVPSVFRQEMFGCKPLFGYCILSLRIIGSFSNDSFYVFFVSFFVPSVFGYRLVSYIFLLRTIGFSVIASSVIEGFLYIYIYIYTKNPLINHKITHKSKIQVKI